MSKINQIRGHSLALWAMLVNSECLKSNSLPQSQVESLLVLDFGEIGQLENIVEVANDYLKARVGNCEIQCTGKGGVSLISHEDDERIVEVYNYWIRALKMSNRTQKTASRVSMIRARLREGFTVDQLKKAIDGLTNIEFYVKNDLRDLKYALGNDEKVRRMANIKQTKESNDPWIRAMRGE